MVVFVTGSSGLIGKWVIESCLANGIEVAGYDNRPCPYLHYAEYCVLGDIRDEAVLSAAIDRVKPDVIVHLAARIDLEGVSLADYDSNTLGVQNICEVAKSQPSVKRVINTSSMLVCKVGYVPVDDQDYCPNTIYGESKVETEKIIRQSDMGDVDWCLVRPTTVWGPYMGDHYKSLLYHILNGNYFHSGSSKLYKSYSFAGNIAHQYLKLILAEKKVIHQKVFYLADYKPLSLREYIDELADTMHVKHPIVLPLPMAKVLALAGDLIEVIGIKFPFNSFRLNNILTEYIFDLSKTREVCGELPYDFHQGVEQTVRWYLADLQSKSKSSPD